MRTVPARIVGFGELVLDHVFVGRERSEAAYVGSAGGGCVWNVLANLASFGHQARALGVTGSDVPGLAALQSLNGCGVNVDRLVRSSTGGTRVIFEWLRGAAFSSRDEAHEFTDLCTICSRRANEGLASVSDRRWDLGPFTDVDYLCVDKLSTPCLQVVRSARKAGAKTVLDCGHTKALRFKPIAHILSALALFDVVLLSQGVAESILRRSGIEARHELARSLGPGKILIISDGRRGASVFGTTANGAEDYYLRPFEAEIVDDAGAGDRLLAVAVDETIAAGCPGREAILGLATRIPEELGSVLRSTGARGHLPGGQMSYDAFSPYLGRTVSELRRELADLPTCPFCSQSHAPTRVNDRKKMGVVGVARNIAELARRSLFAAERHESLAKCRMVLSWGGTACAVATGGSFPAASFISSALNRYSPTFCQAIKPLDYVRLGKHTDWLLVVSYSGRTKDCEEAIRVAIQLGVRRIVLVTSRRDPALGALLRETDLVLTYGNDGARERGFVSISGTVAPCVLWAAACLGTKEIAALDEHYGLEWIKTDELEPVVRTLEHNLPIDVLGGGVTWPAVLDLESKMIEGGLGRATLHEVKDFSHGRFLHAFSSSSAKTWMLFRGAEESSYEDALVETLQKRGFLYELRANAKGLLGGLELLIKAQYIAFLMGRMMGRDISRPGPPPSDGLALYRWALSKNDETQSRE
jgi:sugar/nucleoside kinase (ribokinase family)/fructoselysine-6-P-deglycase FrlB-like protein